MASENPFSSPDDVADTTPEPDAQRISRAYARLIAQARPAEMLVALVTSGFAGLCLISCLLGANVLMDQYAIDLEFAALDRAMMWMTLWKFVQMVLLSYVAFRLFILSGMMARVSPGDTRSVIGLLVAEVSLWWTVAVCSTLIVVGSMALAFYVESVRN